MTLENIRRNEASADLVLYPDVGIFSMLDASGYDTIYDRGLEVAEARLSDILAVSARAPAVLAKKEEEPDERVVGGVKVEGLSEREARDIVKTYSVWIGKSYDIEEIDRAMESLTKRAEISTVDVSARPVDSRDPNVVDVVFSVDRRPPFELALDGYTSNLHRHRWLEVMMNARDLASMGDAANLTLRYGENEWNVNARYFTPIMDGGQWGFALGAKRDKLDPEGFDEYSVERYQARAVYYKENESGRLGFGLAAEHANAKGDSEDYEFGPYLYFNADTLDNLLMPSKGYSFNTQIWWNSDYIWVSRTNMTAYVPMKNNLHFVIDFGLETGEKNHEAYRALLGDQEELFSLSRYPLAGDQAFWARIGVGRNFYHSWWGAIRGEIFASYGAVLNDWDMDEDAWETGAAISIPGEFLNGKILLIYDNHGEFTIGYTLGIPNWWNYATP
jgi:NTE family protein